MKIIKRENSQQGMNAYVQFEGNHVHYKIRLSWHKGHGWFMSAYDCAFRKNFDYTVTTYQNMMNSIPSYMLKKAGDGERFSKKKLAHLASVYLDTENKTFQWIVEKAKPGGVDFPGHPAQGTTLKFNKDGTYKWICGPDWISEEGTWGFTDSKKKLTRTYNDGTKTYTKEWTINEISSDRLVVREVIWGFVFEFRH